MSQSRYYSGPISDHFDGRQFYGPDHSPAKTLGDILKWNFTSKRARWPRHVPNPAPDLPPERVMGAAMRVTMIGHAAVLIQTAGINMLVDPIWSKRASPFQWLGPKRVRKPGLTYDQLPPIDLVLVTHNHYDHLDTGTLHQLVKRFDPLIVTPLGNDTIIRKSVRSARITTIDWDQTIPALGIDITAEPVQHWSSRWLGDRNQALWAGFTINTGARKIFICGDTGFGQGWWAERAFKKHGIFDLALLPIGAYAPRWFMKDSHMNPEEAVLAFERLQCRHALGYHWGTFQLTDEAIDEPRRFLTESLDVHKIDLGRFRTLAPGEAWNIS